MCMCLREIDYRKAKSKLKSRKQVIRMTASSPEKNNEMPLVPFRASSDHEGRPSVMWAVLMQEMCVNDAYMILQCFDSRV